MSPLVYLVILNWNGWQDTLACLRSLEDLDYPNYQIIIVDNASSDGSEDKLREAFPKIRIIQSGANLGYAGGNNIGIRHALAHGADYIWILNNDTIIEPDALTHLVRRMQEKPDAGMCGSRLVYLHNRKIVQALGGGSYNKWVGTTRYVGAGNLANQPVASETVERQIDYIVGASILASRNFLEDIGLLTEDYFLYYEEIDWALRAKGKYSLAVAPQSVVYHREGASTGGNSFELHQKSTQADYYMVRNRLKLTRRFFPEALPTVYLGLGFTILNRILRKQWDRVPMLLKLAAGKESGEPK